MSVRGWPGLTLFNIRLSISPSGSTSLSCCEKTINRPRICHAERLTRYAARRSEQNKTCVFVLSPAKAINICAPLLSSGIYSISVLSHPCWSQLTWRHGEDRHYRAAWCFHVQQAGPCWGVLFWAWLYHISRGVPYPTALPFCSSNPETKPKLCLHCYNYNRSSTICNL